MGKAINISDLHSDATVGVNHQIDYDGIVHNGHSVTPLGKSQDVIEGVKALLTGNFAAFQGTLPGMREFRARNKACHQRHYVGFVERNARQLYPEYYSGNTWSFPYGYDSLMFFVVPDIEYGVVAQPRHLTGSLYNESTKSIHLAIEDLKSECSESEPVASDPATGVDHYLYEVDLIADDEGVPLYVVYRGRVTVNFWFDGEYYYGWDYTSRFEFRLDGFNKDHYPTNVTMTLNSLVNYRIVHSFELTEIALTKKPDDHGPYSWSPYTFGDTTGMWEVVHEPIVHYFSTTETPGTGFSTVRQTSLYTGLTSPFSADYIIDDFDIRNPLIWRDLASLTAIASTDALKQGLTQIDANFLEAAAEIKQLKDLVSPLYVAWNLYKRVRSGDIWGAGVTFLDLLANAKLCYSFGLAPNVSSAKELAAKAGPIVHDLKHLRAKYVTGHGIAPFQIPESYVGLSGVKATGRCTITFRYDPDLCFLGFLLPVKAFGLLPTIANMWDITQFSFLVDWFARVGDKSAHVDTQLQALLLQVAGSCNSMAIDIPLGDSILLEAGLHRLGPSQPSIRLYDRWLEAFIPSYRPTRLDLLPPGGVPDLGLGAALTWTQFRS